MTSATGLATAPFRDSLMADLRAGLKLPTLPAITGERHMTILIRVSTQNNARSTADVIASVAFRSFVGFLFWACAIALIRFTLGLL